MNISPTIISKIAPVRKKMGKNRYQGISNWSKNVSIVISTSAYVMMAPKERAQRYIQANQPIIRNIRMY